MDLTRVGYAELASAVSNAGGLGIVLPTKIRSYHIGAEQAL